MAKKAELEEKKVNGKKKVENDKIVKKDKSSTKKRIVEKNKEDVKIAEEVNDVKSQNTSVIEKSIKDNSKRNKIIKTIIYSLLILLVIGALIYSIIESSENDKYFNTINYNDVSELINDDELNIIYWASPSCGFCVQFTPIVKEVSIEKKVTFNYLNAANISNEDYATFMGQVGTVNEVYSTKGLGTPSIILVKGGQVVDVVEGAQSKANLINYLTTNGFIK